MSQQPPQPLSKPDPNISGLKTETGKRAERLLLNIWEPLDVLGRGLMGDLWRTVYLLVQDAISLSLVLYFSCHSFHAADTAGIEQEVFLLATDSSIDHPEITGISSREILHVIESTRAKKILVVLDTVISGSIFSNGKPAQADMDLANSLRQGIRDLGVNTTEVLEASELDSYLKAC